MHEVLRGGHVLRPRTGAEVLRATRFLFDNPPLAQALAARGRDTAAGFPSPRRVAMGLLEGDGARPAVRGGGAMSEGLRLAVVVPRYGPDLGGRAEGLAGGPRTGSPGGTT